MIKPVSLRRFIGKTAFLFGLSLLATAALGAAEPVKQRFDLPANTVEISLKRLSEQSGVEVLFPTNFARDVRTNPVSGEFTAREALERLLEGTVLMAAQDAKTGALTVRRRADATAEKKAAARAEPTPITRAEGQSGSSANKADRGSDVENAVILSPFEVSSERDTGYAASSSLAGNRLNMDLKDVGAAISVFNEQFLRDTGAVNNESLLQYATNSEVGGVFGTMANAGSGTQLNEGFLNPNGNTRVRGLASADSTRDFFLSDMPWDSYNTQRVEMQRGPNAILFGLGSPAGIINNSTKTAGFKNKGEVEFRYGSYGSNRATLDYNHVLIDRELAFRLDAVRDDTEFQQRPAYQLDRRIFGTVRWEPAFVNKNGNHSTFKVSYEQGKINSNRPRTLTPGDTLTPWFCTGTITGYDPTTGAPIAYNLLNKGGFDARGLSDTGIASTGVSDRGQNVKAYSNGTLNPYWQPNLGGQFAGGYFGNPTAIYDSGSSSAVRLFSQEPFTSRGLNAAGNIDGSISGIPNSRMSSITIYRDFSKKINLPGAKFGLTKNQQLSDPSIFNFYDNLIDGPNKQEWANFHNINLNWSQTFLKGDAGLELVHDRQHFDNGQLTFMGDKNQTIYVDVIQTLADGTANPNFGRPFIADTGGGNTNKIDRRSSRLTAFLKHDFDTGALKHTILGRVLGQQTVTGLWNNDSRNSDFRGFVRYTTDLAYKDLITTPAQTVTIDSSQRQIYSTIYLGPSLFNSSSAAGANIPRPTAIMTPKSGSTRVFDSTWVATGVNPGDVWINPNYPEGVAARTSTQSENPANYRGWINSPITVINSEEGNRDANTNNASLNQSKIESTAIVWQDYIWDHSIVAMYGYRDDVSRSWSRAGARNAVNQVNLDPSSYRLPDSHIRIHDFSNSYSLVAHLTRLFPRIGDRLPFDLSVSYNKSENSQPLAGRVGPLNNPLGPPVGDTTDYGITLSTKDGSYGLKVNRYETRVVNASGTSGFNSFYLGQLFTDYQVSRNIFKYQLGGTTLDTAGLGDPNRWTYQPNSGQSPDQAASAQAADIAGWDAMVASLPKQFFSAYNIAINEVRSLSYSTPSGLTVTENNVSKGYEFELFASPTRNLRLSFNASRVEASRTNVGDPSFNALVNAINTALTTTAAGNLRSNSSTVATPAQASWQANFWASWLTVKGQEGIAVPELRKWRANLVANYDFKKNWLKGASIGLGYRWQDKVIIGYKPVYNNANPTIATVQTFDTGNPYYGPSEANLDLWIGYGRPLKNKMEWHTQLNVRNAFQGDKLVPITTQPDGTPAGYRIVQGTTFSWSNTLRF